MQRVADLASYQQRRFHETDSAKVKVAFDAFKTPLENEIMKYATRTFYQPSATGNPFDLPNKRAAHQKCLEKLYKRKFLSNLRDVTQQKARVLQNVLQGGENPYGSFGVRTEPQQPREEIRKDEVFKGAPVLYDKSAENRVLTFRTLPAEREETQEKVEGPSWPEDPTARQNLRATLYGRYRRFEVEEIERGRGPDPINPVDGLSPPYLYGLEPLRGGISLISSAPGASLSDDDAVG